MSLRQCCGRRRPAAIIIAQPDLHGRSPLRSPACTAPRTRAGALLRAARPPSARPLRGAARAGRLRSRTRSSSDTPPPAVRARDGHGARRRRDQRGGAHGPHTGWCAFRPASSVPRRSPACAAARGAWAVPDYVAHADRQLVIHPQRPGRGQQAGRLAATAVELRRAVRREAPQAWENVAADGTPAGAGVVVAVLDTGVAYANRGPSGARRTSAAPSSSRATTSSHDSFPQRPQRPRHLRRRDDRRVHRQRLRPHRPRLRRQHHARPRPRQPGRRRSVDDRRRRPLRRQPRRARDQPEPRVRPQQ